MKKILVFICLALFTAANSQSLEINTISGGVEIVRTSTNDTLQYTDGASLYAMIDNNNSLRIYQKLGGRVFSPYLFTDVEVDGVAFTDKKTMLSAINQIPAFSLYEVCVDSGEVLGNFLYLFSCDDTTIIDVSGISVQGDSLWTISSGKYEQIYNIPFNQNFQGYKLINDSINLGPVKLPYVGVMGPDLGSYKSLIGFGDATGIGGDVGHFLGYANFFEEKYNAIEVIDTTSISLRNDTTQATLNANGFVLPKMATDPTGEEGAIYYNTTDSLFRGFSYNWATVVLVSDSIYSNNADADNDPNLPSGAGYRISGNRGVLIKP